MEIKEDIGRFYIGEDKKAPLAEIVFSYTGEGIMTIERTYVSEKLRGHSIAAQLLEKTVSKARAEGSKIIPECSYAEKMLNRGEQYRDVLYTK
ncbi:MAG: GNAT family N-acetyltransferase [Synergistaceae bacterium]|nr:GNAT family N-acetyltransferase [Synergistaceae bacterium]